MDQWNWWKSILIGGCLIIAGGFLDDVGSEFYVLAKAVFTESTLEVPLTGEQIIRYLLVGGGILAVIMAGYKIKKSSISQTAEYKLNDLIKELHLFNKKWNKGVPFVSSGYRKQILKKTIWEQNPEKIRNASVKIKRKNAQLKELKIKNASTTLTSVTNISDNIAKLGVDIENIFLTLRQEKEALQENPKILDEYVDEGDQICQNIHSVIVDLEKLRTNVYDLNPSRSEST